MKNENLQYITNINKVTATVILDFTMKMWFMKHNNIIYHHVKFQAFTYRIPQRHYDYEYLWVNLYYTLSDFQAAVLDKIKKIRFIIVVSKYSLIKCISFTPLPYDRLSDDWTMI